MPSREAAAVGVVRADERDVVRGGPAPLPRWPDKRAEDESLAQCRDVLRSRRNEHVQHGYRSACGAVYHESTRYIDVFQTLRVIGAQVYHPGVGIYLFGTGHERLGFVVAVAQRVDFKTL